MRFLSTSKNLCISTFKINESVKTISVTLTNSQKVFDYFEEFLKYAN